MKYANYIVLAFLLCTAFFLKDSLSLSTNLLSLFAPKDSVQNLSVATELGYTKELLVAAKGFDEDSKETVKSLVKELGALKHIESIHFTTKPSKDLQKYYKNNFLLLSSFDAKEQNASLISKKLQLIKEEQSKSFFYMPIDKNDPVKLFTLDSNTPINSKDGYISLGNFGYLLHIQTSVAPSQMQKAQLLYAEIHKITKKYTNVIAFAGFFYTVENASKIKEDVVLIATASVIILFLLYVMVFKNIRILFHTLLALSSASIFASLGSILLFDNFHVLSLAFGVSITAVSIDYLFHYYFHGFYTNTQKLDRNVLYGFLTTLSAFFIFSFIPVALIAQISFFTVLSLGFSYLLFTFVFKKLELGRYKEEGVYLSRFSVLSPYFILLLGSILFGYGIFNVKVDNNIRNLDYNNKELRAIENTFKDSMQDALVPVLVSAPSKEELLNNLHRIKKDEANSFSLANFIETKEMCMQKKKELQEYDFKHLNVLLNEEALKLGFRKMYFEETYLNSLDSLSCANVDFSLFEQYNLKIIKKENTFYTLAFVSQPENVEKYSFVSSINVKGMFERVSAQMYKDIMMYSFIVFAIIIVLLFLSVREKFFYALNYILFPVGVTLSVVVSFFDVNIMHIFGFIILVAIGIDYGIYMSNTQKRLHTMMAIKYSLLSTFGAFGVLVFSSINALHSIGLVISLGVLSIFFLLKVMK